MAENDQRPLKEFIVILKGEPHSSIGHPDILENNFEFKSSLS